MNTTVPIALVKFSVEIASTSAAWLTPSQACQAKVKFASAWRMPATISARDSGMARASRPPATPPSSDAASPTPLMIAA